MRKLITVIGTAAIFSLSTFTVSNAAPVPGFETLYAAAFAACTPSQGVPPNPAACEAAINALSQAMVAAGVAPAAALASFTQLRAEVRNAGGGAAIEALFEELLPDSGSVGDQVSPV